MSKLETFNEGGHAYDSGATGFQALENLEAAVQVNEWVSGLIKPYLGQSNLELGAGTGTISQFFMGSRPVDLCELSEDNQQVLKKRFAANNPTIVSDFFAIPESGQYQCIFSSNVLEHFEDDGAVLVKAHSLLAPGGYFVAYVPANPWLYSKFDRLIGHYRRYSNRDVTRLAKALKEQKLSMELKKASFFNFVGALGWWVRMKLMGKESIAEKDILFYDRIFPYIKWTNVLANSFIGQNMLLVWQKPKEDMES